MAMQVLIDKRVAPTCGSQRWREVSTGPSGGSTPTPAAKIKRLQWAVAHVSATLQRHQHSGFKSRKQANSPRLIVGRKLPKAQKTLFVCNYILLIKHSNVTDRATVLLDLLSCPGVSWLCFLPNLFLHSCARARTHTSFCMFLV